MTSEGLGEMFKGDSADTGASKFPLVSMGGRAEGVLAPESAFVRPSGRPRSSGMKSKSMCNACKKYGQWAGDAACLLSRRKYLKTVSDVTVHKFWSIFLNTNQAACS